MQQHPSAAVQISEEPQIPVWEPQPTVWELLLKHCPENEFEEVKRILGTSLVEQASDLHKEVSTLLDILREIREGTDSNSSCNKVSLSSSSLLAEPPHVRERLIAEIKFFITSLQKKTDHTAVTSHTHIIEYVTHEVARDTRGRPLSAVGGGDGRASSLMARSKDIGDGCNDELDTLNDKINADHIEGIVTKLRKLLRRECDQYHADLQLLQQAIDDELNGTATQEQKPVPTLKELREFGSQLEREYLTSAKFPPASPSRVQRVCDPENSYPPSPVPPAAPKPQHGVGISRASKVRRKTAESVRPQPVASSIIHTSLKSRSVASNEPP